MCPHMTAVNADAWGHASLPKKKIRVCPGRGNKIFQNVAGSCILIFHVLWRKIIMKILIKDSSEKVLHESELNLSGKPIKIGRTEGCEIVVKSISISREHLQIQYDSEGQLCIQDLQSTFGTFVNGKKVQPGFLMRVQPGDQIQLSEDIFMVLQKETGDFSASSQAMPDSTIFPFFMNSNEKFVRDAFHGLKTKIPENYHSDLKTVETAMSEKTRELSAILEVSFALNSLFNYQRLLEYTIDMAIQVTGAERGFIMLHNEETDRLETVVIRRMGTTEVERDMKASSSLVLKCFKTGETQVIGDTSIDPSLVGNKSIILHKIRSVALTPLRIQNIVIGVLYLDSRLSANTFSNQVQGILKVFAAQASVAIHNARLFYMATTDGLTGLTNHKHFQQRLLEEFCRSLRHHKPLSLLMIDIDYFKKINDSFGHQTGDFALRALSKILRSNMRIHDLPARYGGEEFAVLLPESGLEGAKILAEKLRSVVESAEFNVDQKTLKYTVSIGISVTDKRMGKPADLVKAADKALYKAKESGRNRVIVGKYDEPENAT